MSAFAVFATKGFLPLILETSHETAAHLNESVIRRSPILEPIHHDQDRSPLLSLKSILGLKHVSRGKSSVVDLCACAKYPVIISASAKLRGSR
jgi:hypothetical protein